MSLEEPAASNVPAPDPGGRRRSESLRELARRGRGGIDAALRALANLLPIARRVEVVARALAIVSAGSVAFIGLALLVRGFPANWLLWFATAMVVILLATPPFILWLFASALREALLLPERLREDPDLVKAHASEISELVRQSAGRGRHQRGRWVRGLPRDLWQAGKLLLAAHRDLPDYGAAMRLISPPFLVAVALSVPGALVEVALVVPVWILRLVLW